MNFRDAAVLLLSVIVREIFCLLRFFQRGKKDWHPPTHTTAYLETNIRLQKHGVLNGM